MAESNNEALIQHWRAEPAPLLPILHAIHDRDGFISDDALRDVAKGLNIPIAELFGTVTFYHHFARQPPGQQAPRVCTGPICYLAGSHDLLMDLADEHASAMPCSGRCDNPIPVLRGHTTFCGNESGLLQPTSSPLPRENPDGVEECVYSCIRTTARNTLDGYRRSGGYQGLQRVLRELEPQNVVELIDSSGLTGRGGAGFPTGQKWHAVAKAAGTPKTIVCNADEGEPGCFKDRTILDYDPHAIIEGMVSAGYATGANRGFIYLRYEYPESLSILQHAINEATADGIIGKRVMDTDFRFNLYIRRGAGAYICGEEGSLLNSLEGKRPYPRNRPPFPVTHGFEDLPTVVNNVETLASVPHILVRGADWYQKLGRGNQSGTKIVSLSGDIKYPGNYEVPLGLPLATLLYDWAGGPPIGRRIQGVTMAGLSGGFLAGEDLNVNLDEDSIRARGSILGAGGIMVLDDTRNMVEIAHMAMDFFAHESCGKCFPCRIGTQRLAERLNGQAGPAELSEWRQEVEDIGHTMMATSACGLGMAAPNITKSLLKYFPAEVGQHLLQIKV